MPKQINQYHHPMCIPKSFSSEWQGRCSVVMSLFYVLSFFVLLPAGRAQSLYQETYEINQLLDSFAPPTIEILSSGNLTIAFKENTLPFVDSIPFELDEKGLYKLVFSGDQSTAYTLIIAHGWGAYQKRDTLRDLVENMDLYNLPDVVKWNTGNTNGAIVKEDFYKIVSFLGTHVAYRDSLFNFKTLEKIYTKYKDNPFLAERLEKVLFDYDLREIARYMSFDTQKFSDSIRLNLEENYKWLKDLYSLSEAEFIKQVLEQKDETYYQDLEIDDKLSQSKLTIAAEMANAEYAKVTGINTTAIIEGLSDFIVERAQEEVNIAFMDRFKQRMLNSFPNEYSTLFPKTYDLFLQFEIANYKKLIQNARPSFLSDLQSVGLNLPRLLSLEKYKGILDYSPAIYNLALFYNMSQLVYTDRTIDEIMPYAYHHLAERHYDLAEIVNLSIASSIEDSTRVKAFKKAVPRLEQQIKDYCDKAAGTYLLLSQSHQKLIAEIEALKMEVKDIAPELQTGLGNAAESLRSGWAPLSNLEYRIPGQKNQKVFEFYPKYAVANLRGQGYFGDQIRDDNPQFEKYERIFNERLTKKAYIARGLELTRLLLKESFDEKFYNEQELLSDILPQVREVKKSALLLKKKELGNRTKAINQLRDTLVTGLEAEIHFWKGLGVADTTNIDLAALVYLNKLLKNENMSQETWTNVDKIRRMLSFDPQLTAERIQQNDPSLSPQSVRFYLDDADRQMDEIYNKILDRVDYLSSAHPGIRRKPNRALNNYLDTQNRLNLIDPNEFQALNQVQQALDRIKGQRKKLVEHYGEIKGLVVQFDTTFCRPSLSRSRDNALNLAGVMELATHLLFSFKKETQIITVPLANSPEGNTESIEEQIWLEKPAYEQLMEDESTRSIYLGLLYEQLNALQGTWNFTTEGLATISTKLINTIFDLKTGKKSIEVKKKLDLSLNFQDYYPMIKSTVDLVSTIVETPVFNGKALKEMEPALGTISKISSEGLSLYQNINTEQYGFAIYNTMELFRVISDARLDREREQKRRSKKILTLEDEKREKKARARNERIRNNILLYGTLMADVLSATNSDQVKAALRAAATPPGSSRLKRELDFNLSINSYLGLAVGEEKLLNPLDKNKVNARTIGLTVPVGIALSWKFHNMHRSSYTLFLSVLDIGAVTSYRLNDTLASALPKLDFDNFLAPGASLFYNFNKVPISLGVGWQLGPQTRKIDPANPDVTSQASRFLFSINVDVPLFNLVNGAPSTSIRKGRYRKKGW